MASNEPSDVLDSAPFPKRLKTATGYKSASDSARNTHAYNSDSDSGDDLFADFVPGTAATYQTQPTQILDRSAIDPASSPPNTPQKIVQVPASSPFRGRDSEGPKPVQGTTSAHFDSGPKRKNLGSLMAPAGTSYKAPAGILSKPPPKPKTVIQIDDEEDDEPKFQGGSSDDEGTQSANIKHTSFVAKDSRSSSGATNTGNLPKPANGNAQFHSIMENSTFKPSQPRSNGGSAGIPSARKPQTQARPERAAPIQDISIEMVAGALRDNVLRLKKMFPTVSIGFAQNVLLIHNNCLSDAVDVIGEGNYASGDTVTAPLVIDDDEVMEVKRPEDFFKRTLTGPTTSLRDRYSSTQAKTTPDVAATPPKPKRRLMKGRRNASSPVIPALSSPLQQKSPVLAEFDDYDSDSGVSSDAQKDSPLSDKVLEYFNTCKVADLVELTGITKEVAELMLAARPFRSLDAARTVENTKATKSGKKSNRAPVGDKIVDTAIEMFEGYEAIDTLVATCGDLGKPLAVEMAKWGFDIFGASKTGELEMTSLEDDAESTRDSGIGSPSSASNNGDDEVKIVGSTRRRGNVQFLKKPELMAEDCVLKDYQVVGLNWLALMYRHKLSCILADEMGLGKTCQVIAFLTHLVENGQPGPHLVVCPGSTLENWLREFQRFSPHLKVEPYHGMVSICSPSEMIADFSQVLKRSE